MNAATTLMIQDRHHQITKQTGKSELTSRVVQVDSGHVVMAERPEEFVKLVRDFIRW